jgi:hypothetical protein
MKPIFPLVFDARPRAEREGWYASSRTTFWTDSRVPELTYPRLLITSETVESDNPDFLATSRMVGRCFTRDSSKRFNAKIE